jgi:hypothetical protein
MQAYLSCFVNYTTKKAQPALFFILCLSLCLENLHSIHKREPLMASQDPTPLNKRTLFFILLSLFLLGAIILFGAQLLTQIQRGGIVSGPSNALITELLEQEFPRLGWSNFRALTREDCPLTSEDRVKGITHKQLVRVQYVQYQRQEERVFRFEHKDGQWRLPSTGASNMTITACVMRWE